MAIWQFNIYLIPRKSLLNKYGQVPTDLFMDTDGWNKYFENADLDNDPDFEDALTVHWWLDLNVNLESFLPSLNLFGGIQSWTQTADGLTTFGDADTNDISVCFNSATNMVEEVSCRLDLRQPQRGFIDKIFSLANAFDCLLMDRQGRLFNPSIVALLERIKISNANRFVADPEQFLKDLSQGTLTTE